MSADLKRQIRAEIARVLEAIESQKVLIKDSVERPLMLETATLEMKALHTRLAVLESNLAKETGHAGVGFAFDYSPAGQFDVPTETLNGNLLQQMGSAVSLLNGALKHNY